MRYFFGYTNPVPVFIKMVSVALFRLDQSDIEISREEVLEDLFLNDD